MEIQGKKREGKIIESHVPAVIYGAGVDNLSIQISQQEVHKIRQYSNSSLLTLVIDNEKHDVMIKVKETQYHPVSQKILHLDFIKITEVKPIKVFAKINYINAKDNLALQAGGKLNVLCKQVEIFCRKKNFIEFVDCDLSKLKPGKSLMLKELGWPQGIWIKKNLPIVSIIHDSVEEKDK